MQHRYECSTRRLRESIESDPDDDERSLTSRKLASNINKENKSSHYLPIEKLTLTKSHLIGENIESFKRPIVFKTRHKRITKFRHRISFAHDRYEQPIRQLRLILVRSTTFRFAIFLFLPLILMILLMSLVEPALSSNPYQTALTTQQHTNNLNSKNSGQFYVSQLCSPRSPFPITRRVEGATLTSTATDTDFNCTITFRTKSAQQHFVIRFEELKLGCDDHLVLFDGDLDYGQPSIKDFSCRDNMASVPIIKTTGTFLTIRLSTDGLSKMSDGFRLVVTAVFDITMSDCPPEYAFCRSQLCISRSLFCDGINHCLDNSDEIGCGGHEDTIELPYALGFFVILVLVISTGVIVCIILHCRRDNPYADYQQQMHRAFGVPLQASNSVMFANHHQQPPYQFFQPANMSPYVTPQHHALIATLPRGYSTLPLNLIRQQHQQPHLQHPQTILAKQCQLPTEMNGEYLMMSGLGAPQQQTANIRTTAQATAFHHPNMISVPNSHSILSSGVAMERYNKQAPNGDQRSNKTSGPPTANNGNNGG